MTRRFRLGLFVSIAAAVGLHLRPCVLCVRGLDHVQPFTDVPAPSVERPALAHLCVGPTLDGVVTADSKHSDEDRVR